MPKPYPEVFRRDVVAVARKREAPLEQIAKDFGISETCLKNWLRKADIEDGTRPGLTRDESDELREARKRIRLLEQEAEVMRRAVAYLSRDVNPLPFSKSETTRFRPLNWTPRHDYVNLSHNDQFCDVTEVDRR